MRLACLLSSSISLAAAVSSASSSSSSEEKSRPTHTESVCMQMWTCVIVEIKD